MSAASTKDRRDRNGYVFCCPVVGMYRCKKPDCRCEENWNAERDAEADVSKSHDMPTDTRDLLIRTIITVGMMRRDVAQDVADALIADGWKRNPCLHEKRKPILTEVGLAQQCVECGDQDFGS